MDTDRLAAQNDALRRSVAQAVEVIANQQDGIRSVVAILRELVEGEHAAVTEYCRCSYCKGLAYWKPEFVVDHKPDCPIARGRELLARIDSSRAGE